MPVLFPEMNYINEYKKFINSYNFSDAVRVSIGIILPAVIFGYYGQLSTGILVSLGAMVTSTADVPGPIQRRMTGMVATILLIFIIASIIGYSNSQHILLGFIIAGLCFILTLIGIYGNRVNNIGFAGLLIMVLSLDRYEAGWQVLEDSLFLFSGGLWYILLSLALFRMRPYKIVQQALGDCIISIADYLKIRSYFYDADVDYEKTYTDLMIQQEAVHAKQEQLREMIFKSRQIISQSTVTSRTLLIIFIESIDFFEKATATLYNYKELHNHFDDTHILDQFKEIIGKMTNELTEIGMSVQAGLPSKVSKDLNSELNNLKTKFDEFVSLNRSPKNIEALVSLRKIMQMLEDMVVRIYTLHHYTRYDKKRIKGYKLSKDYDSFVSTPDLDIELLKENFSFNSNHFRHALRVSIATTIGYILSFILKLDYSNWVLLTILVILKPTYSLSKQRNLHRLLGTVIGAAISFLVLYLIPSEQAKFAVMVVFILLTYSFIRTNYFISVLFMTGYVMILFYILNANHFLSVIENRVVDTLIGSVIAFLSTYIFVPSWEKEQIRNYMQKAIENASGYFDTVSKTFITGQFDDLKYRLSRKNAFIAQSNLSGAFNRMMNEPKSKQENIKNIHQFTVLIYTLNSHIASLAHFAQKTLYKYHSLDFKDIGEDILAELGTTNRILTNKSNLTGEASTDVSKNLKFQVNQIVEKRSKELRHNLMDTETRTILIEYKPILDQFLFISRIAEDLKAVSGKF